jgi:hypothetical protein
MRRSRTPVGRRRSAAACAVLLALFVTVLVATAPAGALSGRVGPQSAGLVRDGALRARMARGDGPWYGIYDAQSTGALLYSMQEAAPQMTLTATDAAGAVVWSTETGDTWAASGTLPAALVATFVNPDPNVVRDGDLIAYGATGAVTFHKSFKREFVQPLACTTKRLVWAETTAKAVTRVYVRQGGKTHSLALSYVPPKAHFLAPASASADGRCILLGEYMPVSANRSLHMTYWVKVDPSGRPRLVSHRATEWVGASLTPSGDRAAIMTSQSIGGVGNLWMSFGRFAGPEFAGENAGDVYASATRIFEQGGYTYGSESIAWGTTSVSVFDRSLTAIYQRAWTFEDDHSSVWFTHDRRLAYLAGTTNAGLVTVMNVDDWDTQVLPGAWAAVTPTSDGRLATMTTTGAFSYIPNPVAGP